MDSQDAASGRKRRSRHTPQQWRRLLNEFSASGLTVSEFCQRASLSKATFQRWRSRFQATATPVVPAIPREACSPFIEMESRSLPRLESSPRLDLRLELGGGIVLRLVRG